MRIAVLIRALNEEAHVGRLLSGIQQQKMRVDEVVLVDSGSTDATVSIATNFDNVKVVTISPQEFSFGRALNVGMAATTADVVILASAHVYPLATSWVAELCQPFERDDVVMTYGRQVGDQRTTFSEHQVFRKWFPEQSDPNQLHPFCNNANAAVRRTWWLEHPYDEALTGLEDLAMAKEALAAKRGLAYVATAPVAHVHEETFSRTLNRYRREGIAFKAIFPGQTMTLQHTAFLVASNIAADLYQAARQRELGAVRSILPFRVAQFVGGYLGHRQHGAASPDLTRRFYYPKRFWRQAPEEPLPGESIEYGSVHVG